MLFAGREKEIAAITTALDQERHLIVMGKYGIGKSTLVKQSAKMNGQKWRFLFVDFSTTPSKVCNKLLREMKPRRPSRGYTGYEDYRQSRSLILDLASKDKRRYVMVLDNIEKLSPQKLGLIRYLARDKRFLFIAITERFLPDSSGILQTKTNSHGPKVTFTC